jgi:voltage-gated potassium channel
MAHERFARNEKGSGLRFKVYELLEGGRRNSLWPKTIDLVLTILIISNVAAIALATVDEIFLRHETFFFRLEIFSVTVFTIEYLLRVWVAPEHLLFRSQGPWTARGKFMLTPLMLIDLLAIAPALTFYLIGGDLRIVRVFRVLRLLKLVRYSPAIVALWRVLYSERRALAATLVIMMCLLVLTAGVMYLIEREAQPEAFGSIPSAMWWSLATLSTVGYGDVVPITVFGKLVGGFVALLGIAMYGLPIAIVASGFTNEFYRRDFIITWGMVAEIPVFFNLSPKTIDHAAKSFHARRVPAGYRIMERGEMADAFYVIVEGKVKMTFPDKTLELETGEYFGVISMLYGIERPAHADAVTDCRLMMLSKMEFEHLMTVEPDLYQELHKEAVRRASEGGVNLT